MYRHLLRARRAVVMGHGDSVCAGGLGSVAYHTATTAFSAGATSVELGGLLRASVDTLPQSVIWAIFACEELVGPEGGLQPLGVAAGIVFAMLTLRPA